MAAGARLVLPADGRELGAYVARGAARVDGALVGEKALAVGRVGAPLVLEAESDARLAIVEGFKAERHPKIEVHRAANGKPFLFAEIPNVRAIAADAPVPGAPIPVVPLDDADRVADVVMTVAESLEPLLGRLRGGDKG